MREIGSTHLAAPRLSCTSLQQSSCEGPRAELQISSVEIDGPQVKTTISGGGKSQSTLVFRVTPCHENRQQEKFVLRRRDQPQRLITRDIFTPGVAHQTVSVRKCGLLPRFRTSCGSYVKVAQTLQVLGFHTTFSGSWTILQRQITYNTRSKPPCSTTSQTTNNKGLGNRISDCTSTTDRIPLKT